MEEYLEIEAQIVDELKTIFDPEIPVNIYDLGLIYEVEVSDNADVMIQMTLTAPNCPAADFILQEVQEKVENIEKVRSVQVDLVFEPAWDKDMMTEEAQLELGFL